MKKIVSLMLALVMSLTFSVSAFAIPFESEENMSGTSYIETYGRVTSTGPTTTGLKASGIMSFEEVSQDLAETEGISLEEAMSIINPDYQIDPHSTEELRYRTLTSQIEVNPMYKPSIKFYCVIDGSTSMWGIVSIEHIYYDWEYNNMVKVFDGDIYVRLRNAYQIFYIISGHFYNTGTTSIGGGADIKVGEELTINISAQHAFDHYDYISKEVLCSFQQ